MGGADTGGDARCVSVLLWKKPSHQESSSHIVSIVQQCTGFVQKTGRSGRVDALSAFLTLVSFRLGAVRQGVTPRSPGRFVRPAPTRCKKALRYSDTWGPCKKQRYLVLCRMVLVCGVFSRVQPG